MPKPVSQKLKVMLISIGIAIVIVAIVFGIYFGVKSNSTEHVPQPSVYYIKSSDFMQDDYVGLKRGESMLIEMDSDSYRSLVIYDKLIVVGELTESYADSLPRLVMVDDYDATGIRGGRNLYFDAYKVSYDTNGGRCLFSEANRLGLLEEGSLSNCAQGSLQLLPMYKEGFIFKGWDMQFSEEEDYKLFFTAHYEPINE